MANKQSPFQNVRVVFQPGNPKLKKRLIALILASMLALGALAFVHHRIQVRTQALLEEAAALEQEKQHLHLYAVVDGLKFLRKGGRLPAAVAVAGSILGIKPLICIKEGKVAIAGKARGLPGAYVALFKFIEAAGGIDFDRPYVTGYTDKAQQVEPICRYFDGQLKACAPLIGRIGCVIGTHAGPGTFGLAFFDPQADGPQP